VLIAISAYVIGRNANPPKQVLKYEAFQAIGEIAAKEISGLVGGTGTILVITRKDWDGPSIQVAIDTFTDRLKSNEGVDIGATEIIVVPVEETVLPASEFFQIIRLHPECSGVVSFAGPPDSVEGHWSLVAGLKAKVLVLALSNTGTIREYLSRGAIHAAIVPQSSIPAAGLSAPSSLHEWFERSYQLITSDNLHSTNF
jgi:hypothetical protein